MDPETPGLLALFRASMDISQEKWHDGIGYDLSLLSTATSADLEAIENLLVSRGVSDWRDAEALAALDTERTRETLRRAFASGGEEIRQTISLYAPELTDPDLRTDSLIKLLRSAPLFGALSGALDEIAGFHPPAVIDALFEGLKEREGDVAVHFAAMLFYLHGKSEEPFDFLYRDFFLEFNTDDPKERDNAIKKLQSIIKNPVNRD